MTIVSKFAVGDVVRDAHWGAGQITMIDERSVRVDFIFHEWMYSHARASDLVFDENQSFGTNRDTN